MSREERTHRRRAEIVNAAYRLFGEHGYHETSIADLAKQLDIGHGTFYLYFKNKLDIFVHVIDLIMAKVSAVAFIEEPTATRSLPEYRAQLERIGEKIFEVFVEDRYLAVLLFREAPGLDPRLDAKIEQAIEVLGGLTAQYLANGVKRKFLRADLDSHTTALAVNAMILEGVRRVTTHAYKPKLKQQWIDAVARLMLDGMAA